MKHYYLHELYCYIGFLLHIPFHLHHKSEGYPDYDFFTLRGSIICECGYAYDRGYVPIMQCKKCQDEFEARFTKLENC